MKKTSKFLVIFASLICTILFIVIKNFLIVPIFILVIYIIYLKIKIHKQKLEIKTLNEVNDSTRSFRHDFNNIMQAIGGYIQTNNLYDLKEYFNNLVPECFKVNNLYRYHSKLMANSAVYSIIADKYNKAEKLNIKMSLNIISDINKINLDSYHLTKILGIFLDNAIEASKECSKKIINISFKYSNNKQLILVENTYLNKNISIKKIFEKNFSSKLNHSGLGLWEVNKIVNKHKNLNLYTITDNNFFTQKLEIL